MITLIDEYGNYNHDIFNVIHNNTGCSIIAENNVCRFVPPSSTAYYGISLQGTQGLNLYNKTITYDIKVTGGSNNCRATDCGGFNFFIFKDVISNRGRYNTPYLSNPNFYITLVHAGMLSFGIHYIAGGYDDNYDGFTDEIFNGTPYEGDTNVSDPALWYYDFNKLYQPYYDYVNVRIESKETFKIYTNDELIFSQPNIIQPDELYYIEFYAHNYQPRNYYLKNAKIEYNKIIINNINYNIVGD
jgi:hypothetical protein